MNLQRVRSEVIQASNHFDYVEAHPTTSGEVYVKAALQTSAGKMYIVSITLPDYPSKLPQVTITQPMIRADAPHRYTNGTICYMYPAFWNPGQHTLTVVLTRIAKWLNKYEVWLATNRWPGAEIRH